jgi:uncharacterized membrane protein YqhA
MFRLALSLRFIMLLASLGATLGAMMMFWVGAEKLVRALKALVAGGDDDTTSVVMAATDSFLFGIVLMIFTYAIMFGFVFQLPEEERRQLPAWMRIEGVGELKHTLVEVILVYLIVDFATDIAEPAMHHSWQMLAMPLSILLLAGALRLMSATPHVAAKDHGGKL